MCSVALITIELKGLAALGEALKNKSRVYADNRPSTGSTVFSEKSWYPSLSCCPGSGGIDNDATSVSRHDL